MPIKVRFQNDSEQECVIRPTPFVATSTNLLKNGAGEAFGVTYTITLNGTILPDEGFPFAVDHITGNRYGFFEDSENETFAVEKLVGPYKSFDNKNSYLEGSKPPRQKIGDKNLAAAVFSKQKALRSLFAQDGQRLEITDVQTDEPYIVCYPRLVDINFTEGQYVTKAEYTITLEADTLLYGPNPSVDDDQRHVDHEATFVAKSLYGAGGTDDKTKIDKTEKELIDEFNAAFVSDFSEDWSIEVDESQGNVLDGRIIPRSYRVTHNMSATGKTHYVPPNIEEGETAPRKLPAWVQARNFIHNKLKLVDKTSGAGTNLSSGEEGTPYPNTLALSDKFHMASGTLNLSDSYRGYNHVRTENLSESAGTFSVTETWLLADGSCYERYNMNVSTSNTDPFITVSIDGNVKGLEDIPPSGFGGNADITGDMTSAYDNAIAKYHDISNNGQFGISSDVYKRANNQTDVQLNSQPTSVSLGVNEFTGEITYNLSFNNRPTNYITGTISEAIQVNDTYPGDVFAVIPVIGRVTGPVLQYIGGRTEYKRDISVNLTMDYTRVPYSSGRNPMLLMKPSVAEPTASELQVLLRELSPQGEPGVRKYFMNPPTESWSPKEGTYSFNASFTYELDK